MTPEIITAIAPIVSSVLSAISLVLVEYIRRRISNVQEKVIQVEKTVVTQKVVLEQLEKQGNSAKTAGLRAIMISAQLLADAVPTEKNRQIADEAERIHAASVEANDNL